MEVRIETTKASIDTLIAYVEQYRPGFRATIRGASEEEVAELEGLVGQPLPPAYRQFLRRMGHNHAGLWLLGQYDGTTLAAVTEYYEEAPLPPPTIVPEDCLLILESEIGGTDLFLYPKRAPDPQVVMNGPEGYYAASLLSLLYYIAFRTFRLDALVHREYFLSLGGADARDLLPEAVALAEAAGFQRQWFSDRRAFCGERPDGEAAVHLRQSDYKPRYGRLALGVAAGTVVEAERLAAPFLARFG